MIDFDNTIVNLNKQVIDYINKRFNKNITTDDIDDYVLNNVFSDNGLSGNEVYNVLEDIFTHDDIYYNIKKMENYDNILNIVMFFKNYGLRVILNSHCMNSGLMCYKLNFLKENMPELYNLIDSFLFSKPENGIWKDKDYHYDVVIEDNPDYIKNYLEKNTSGIVIKQDWKYNNHLKDKRIISIDEVVLNEV